MRKGKGTKMATKRVRVREINIRKFNLIRSQRNFPLSLIVREKCPVGLINPR